MDGRRVGERLHALVSIASPTGSERSAVDLVAGWLGEAADEVDRWTAAMSDLERDPAYPGREVERAEVPVVAARVSGSRPGPVVVLTGHVDTVGLGEQDRWTRDPAGEWEGDLLYGRGAADMKAGVVAAVEAFAAIAAGDRDFAGEVRLVAVSGEEDGGTGTLAAIRRGWTGDLVILTEPTSGPDGPQVVTAHGGALTFTIEVEGRAAHGATPGEGVSALDGFVTIYRALRDLEDDLAAAERDPRMAVLARPYPTTVGMVRGGSWASNVMERLTADARAGVALGETVVAAEERFRTTLLAAVAGDPWLRAHPPSVTRTGAAFGASSIPDHHPLVDAVRAAAGAVTGTRPASVGVPYGCDMALWTSAGGAACLVYGPGDIRHAHAADERVSLTETVTVAAALEEAVRRVTA